MAHFAEIDKNNTVLRTIVISNSDILDENGVEQESIGIAICHELCGNSNTWLQTSINNRIRKNYAFPGFKYNSELDVFYNPVAPFKGWVLDVAYDWQPPVMPPDDGKKYIWDEDELIWKEVE